MHGAVAYPACKPLGATDLAWAAVAAVVSAGHRILELFVQTIKNKSEQVHGILQEAIRGVHTCCEYPWNTAFPDLISRTSCPGEIEPRPAEA